MKQYKDLIQKVLDEGSRCEGRNGVTYNLFGETMTFYMKDGFPIPTIKHSYFKSALRELKGFTCAFTNAAEFRLLKSNVWDKNANEPSWLKNPYRKGGGDLGPIYGEQWRKWSATKYIPLQNDAAIADAIGKGYRFLTRVLMDNRERFAVYHKHIDQFKEALQAIHETPTSRRILFHAWNPAELDEMSLPSCHTLYQFGVDVERKRLSMNIYIRSNDIGLGMPFNIIESAFLLHMFARLTGYEAYKLQYTIGDAHIYENQLEMCKEMLTREPKPLPTLVFGGSVPDYNVTGVFDPSVLDTWSPEDQFLKNYEHHSAIGVEMIA